MAAGGCRPDRRRTWGEKDLCKRTVAEDGAIECTSPAFEGAAEPFETTVQVSLDGQHFAAGGGATFKYEGGGAKKK